MTVLALADVLVVALVSAAVWSSPALARPTLPFGVRVPAGRVDDSTIVAQRRAFGRRVVAVGVLAALAAVSLRALRNGEPSLGIVLPAMCTIDGLLAYVAAREIRAVKQRENWYFGSRQAVLTDTRLRADPVRIPWPLIVPAVLLLVGTAVTGAVRYDELPPTLVTPDVVGSDRAGGTATTFAGAFAPVFGQGLVILLALAIVAAILRARPDLDAERPANSVLGYHTYLRGVSRMLLLSAGCANATLLLLALQKWEVLDSSADVVVATYAPLCLALVGWIFLALRVGEAGHRLPVEAFDKDDFKRVQRDDDRFWCLAGMIYANRQDPALLVHRRVGMYWTLNLGHPVSWAILACFGVLAILASSGVITLPE